jgi:hypothetical protein
MTAQQIAEKARIEWNPITSEPITCEFIKGTIYAYGSELACLRLEHKMPKGRANYSQNLSTWYYALDTMLQAE